MKSDLVYLEAVRWESSKRSGQIKEDKCWVGRTAVLEKGEHQCLSILGPRIIPNSTEDAGPSMCPPEGLVLLFEDRLSGLNTPLLIHTYIYCIYTYVYVYIYIYIYIYIYTHIYIYIKFSMYSVTIIKYTAVESNIHLNMIIFNLFSDFQIMVVEDNSHKQYFPYVLTWKRIHSGPQHTAAISRSHSSNS